VVPLLSPVLSNQRGEKTYQRGLRLRLPGWRRTALTLTLTLTRSDAFDALHLEYTVHLLTTWRKVRVRVGVRVRVRVRVP